MAKALQKKREGPSTAKNRARKDRRQCVVMMIAVCDTEEDENETKLKDTVPFDLSHRNGGSY